mgnify:CR=1 FL=1
MADLAGKRALVCGGTSGIGAVTVAALRDLGPAVPILARSPRRCAALGCDLGVLDAPTITIQNVM